MPNSRSIESALEREAVAALGQDTLDPLFGRMEATLHKSLSAVEEALQRCASMIPQTEGAVFQLDLDSRTGKWRARGLLASSLSDEAFRTHAAHAFDGLGGTVEVSTPTTASAVGGLKTHLVQVGGDYYGDASYSHTFNPQVRKASATKTAARIKTAGEVRFIKDRSGDANEWGWGSPGPSQREMVTGFEFNPKNLKPLARALRATLAALGHAMSAYTTFSKIKSATISPDGSLGGKGYIAKIADMRRQYMNIVEALSALSDTLYDEIHAPHWSPVANKQDPREREEVREIMDDAEEIKDDPEGWAIEEEEEMSEEGKGKRASSLPMSRKASSGYQASFQVVVSNVQQVRLKNRILEVQDLAARVATRYLKERGDQ